MNLERLSEEERLDLEILARTVDIKDLLGSGEVMMMLEQADSTETVGKLIKRALSHADGAIIKVRLRN